jgi:DNA polymerase-3 subunit gamma/tau
VAGDHSPNTPERLLPSEPPLAARGGYTVVARRYRPQRFEDVVGQDHVVQSLRNAILMQRVTHAYLFSGTRGVGKTSVARIFAKCLNCVHGPTVEPCMKCDICQAIAVGQDVDVIEIDGASNNGVEAVRELRQNAGLRPSRARFKIYYIDEVHMLSTGAFNALLKTLEEPPEHVKFFFATTEPNKIPITVLSRCQRYDFAGIAPEEIVTNLEAICRREDVEAEPEALRSVARRAGGSMRDAQSLLERLLGSGKERLTVERVHALLGTASDERVLDQLDALADHDAARALSLLDAAAGAGVQPVDLLNGLLEFLRDVMVLAAGAEGTLLAVSPRQQPRVQAIVDRWPLDTILAALQILDTARARLRGSPHGRLLVEMALVRIARLEKLHEIGDLIARLTALEAGLPPAAGPSPGTGTGTGAGARRKSAPPMVETPAAAPAPAPSPAVDGTARELERIRQLWPDLIKKVGVKIGALLSQLDPAGFVLTPPDVLVIRAGPKYNWIADECDQPEPRARIEKNLQKLLDQAITVRFERTEEPGGGGPDRGGAGRNPGTPPSPNSEARRPGNLDGDSMVQKVVQLFEARLVHREDEDERRTGS